MQMKGVLYEKVKYRICDGVRGMTKPKVSPKQRAELRVLHTEAGVNPQQYLYEVFGAFALVSDLLDDLAALEARLTPPFTQCQPQVGECRLIHGHMGRHNAFADWPPPLSNIAWEPDD